jgi:hypothetical protein
MWIVISWTLLKENCELLNYFEQIVFACLNQQNIIIIWGMFVLGNWE